MYVVETSGEKAAAKLIHKDPGADRELLFVDLSDVANVVPIIDSGEVGDFWVLVMPLAERSLKEHLDKLSHSPAVSEALPILLDIATALVDLDGRVVHRDLKPGNVLLVEGTWCLADFGISRYAEATTAPDTQKFALSPPYAAPERWRSERATSATDVYSFGVIAFEMLAGDLPFKGPTTADFRQQHLHEKSPSLEGVPSRLSALVDECLYKAPGARPRPANLAQRLERVQSEAPTGGGLGRLQAANREEVSRRAELARHESQARSAEDQRQELFGVASRGLDRIGTTLKEAIIDAAPSASLSNERSGWTISLNQATLGLSNPRRTSTDPWQWERPTVDVIAHAELNLRIPKDRYEYEGRSHSLWFCDPQDPSDYDWYETAFMISALIPQRGRQNPFALDPGEAAAKALWSGMAEYQLAWPFTRLVVDDLDDFIDRWAGWFADAAQARLTHPSTMPERPTQGSWRR